MKNIVTVVLMIVALSAVAQKKGKKSAPEVPKPVVEEAPKPEVKPQPADTAQQFNPLVAHFLRKRNLALKWNDAVSAKNALLDLVVETGNDSLAYLLAVAYYENREFAPAALIAKDLLTVNPKNLDFLQISAVSLESLGLKDKALPDYESMYLYSENTPVLYKIANLQYETKRYPECKANIDILMTRPDLDSLSVTAPMPDNKSKNFPIKVAILNLKGLLAVQMGDKATARKAFQDALVIAPDFPQSKENLAKLK